MRVLVVEDDLNLNRIIVRGLSEEGYAVDTVEDGTDGQYMAEVNPYDLIILDWMLPGKSGLEICQALRRQGKTMPILMLTARTAVADRVVGLDGGADDYLSKPFAFDELLARLRALLRRPTSEGNKTNLLQVADLTLEVASRVVKRGEQFIELTTKEFVLLEYFMHHVGKVLSRQEIEEHAWNNEYASESNLIEVYISRLRRKLDDPFEVKLFETIKGAGYRLVDPTRKVLR